LLYREVQEHLETFLLHRFEEGRPVPGFVTRELRRYLECGILSYGFGKLRCGTCRASRLAAFSCKGRGFCPSCGGRRMSDTAAHLVDHVLPDVPMRQWVLSVPYPLRLGLAYDAALLRDVLGICTRARMRSYQRRAATQIGVRGGRSGSVTFIQRFGGAVHLNVHIHVLVMDGGYTALADSPSLVSFHALSPPSDTEVASVLWEITERTQHALARRGLLKGALAPTDAAFLDEQPLLSEIYAASLASQIATGPRRGRRVMRLCTLRESNDAWGSGPLRARGGGLSLHANTSTAAQDRSARERLCRYAGRPAIATERLARLQDGRLSYALERAWRDAATHVAFLAEEFLEKLCSLAPAPRVNLGRYRALAPGALLRPGIVAQAVADAAQIGSPSAGRPSGVAPPRRSRAASGSPPPPPIPTVSDAVPGALAAPRRRSLLWVELLMRSFRVRPDLHPLRRISPPDRGPPKRSCSSASSWPTCASSSRRRCALRTSRGSAASSSSSGAAPPPASSSATTC
jgi:hypothetical protein